MKNRDRIRMGSFRALMALLDEPETSALPGLARVRAAFIIEVRKAEVLEKLPVGEVRLAVDLRNAAFQKLHAVVLRVGGRASSYAAETGDPQLVMRCQVPLREICRGPYRLRLVAAERVHDHLAELLPVLEDADITAAHIAELAEALADARTQMVEPRQKLGRRVSTTAELNQQVRHLAEFVRRRLDPIFRPLRETDPALHRRYLIARKQLHRSPAKPEDDTAAGSTTPPEAGVRLAA